MRIWSLHPKYLDKAGLGAVWREGLLAQKVLRGLTKGYKHHSQLIRFKATEDALQAICTYLHFIADHAINDRSYNYNRDLIVKPRDTTMIEVTSGQMSYETSWLLEKLEQRDLDKYEDVVSEREVEPHPMFEVVEGPIESWEKI